MKPTLYLFSLSLLLLLVGCQSNDAQVSPVQEEQASLSQPTEKWKLTQVVYTSMIAGQANTTAQPPYEEMLELKADGTFRRYRSNGYEAIGTYSAKQYSADEQGFLATFEDKSQAYHDLPGYRQYSHAEGQVYFRQVKADQLVESYQAADGPSFVYQKLKEQE